ncbi:MAG: DUF5009 domain-containing protein [Fimbriimonadaceae bacterium]
MKRCLALDSFRGYLILGVIFAYLMPREGLPSWLYAAKHGLGASDLLFPGLLFCLGVAIPLSMEKRLPQGEPVSVEEANQHVAQWVSAAGRLVLRASLLVGVAYVLPNLARAPEAPIFFVLLCLVLVRLDEKQETASLVLNCIGIAAIGIALLKVGFARSPDKFFLILGFNALAGGLTFLFARKSSSSRLMMMLIWGLILIVGQQQGWVRQMVQWRVLGELQPLALLKFQLVVLPGIALGDALLHSNEKSPKMDRWPMLLNSLFGLVGICLTVWAANSGELEYGFVLCTLLGINAIWFAHPWSFMRSVQSWGWGLLLIGMLLVPMGGVHAGPGTLSYMLLAAGVGTMVFGLIWALTLFTRVGRVAVSEEALRELALDRSEFAAQPEPRQGYVALGGQNPLVAYMAVVCLAISLPRLTGLEAWHQAQKWGLGEETAYAAALTLTIGALAAGLTRLGLRLRA